ncbi:hypothetical protein PGB90_008596 [Kerria lacca]
MCDIHFIIQNFFKKRKDLFGENSKYLNFNIPKKKETDYINSRITFGTIEYENNGKKHFSESLCLKQTPDIIYFQFFNTASFSNELYFYAKMLPFFKTIEPNINLFSKFYDGGVEMNEKEDDAYLILEDLRVHGFVDGKYGLFQDFQHLSLMMRKLGEFHSFSYKARITNSYLFTSLSSCFSPIILTIINDFRPAMETNMKLLLEYLRNDPKYSKKLTVLETFFENPYDAWRESVQTYWKNSTSVISHLNYLARNALFRYVNDVPVDMKILDMAYCLLLSPGVDISYLLYISADQRMRDDHWNDLIDEYYGGLNEHCNSAEIPTKDFIKNEINRNSCTFALLSAVTYLPQLVRKYKTTASHSKSNSIKESKKNLVTVFEDAARVNGMKEVLDIFKDAIDRGFFEFK